MLIRLKLLKLKYNDINILNLMTNSALIDNNKEYINLLKSDIDNLPNFKDIEQDIENCINDDSDNIFKIYDLLDKEQKLKFDYIINAKKFNLI